MSMLNINDLKTGMILAQSVVNKHNVVILGKNHMLTEKYINYFKTWGITEVDIKDINSNQVIEQKMEALSNDVIESIERELDELFPPFEANSLMERIYKIVKKISLKQAGNQTNSSTDEIEKY